MSGSQKHVGGEKATDKRINTAQFHLYKLQVQEKTYGDRSQNRLPVEWGGVGIDWKGAHGNFWEWWTYSLS